MPKKKLGMQDETYNSTNFGGKKEFDLSFCSNVFFATIFFFDPHFGCLCRIIVCYAQEHL
jgi:hypothetical protein